MAELLAAEGLFAGYGDSMVLEGVSLALGEGGSLALLGRNGVGKTTLLLTLMGLTRLWRGRLVLKGQDITQVPTFRRARAGLGWAPQERLMFPSLTVEEHLKAVARPGPWDLARTYRMFPALDERKRHRGNQLSGGERQMLAIARALMTNPSLLLLDEPMEGLAPVIVEGVIRVIDHLVRSGDLGVIIVEQHARLALSLTQDAIVLNRGRVTHRGASASLLEDAAILERLLAVT